MDRIKVGSGVLEVPEALRRIPGAYETANITISKKEYEALIKACERLRVLSNYIMNNEYYSVDTMRALVGYTEGSGEE